MVEKPNHPYADLPDAAYWRTAVADVAADAFDPVVASPFVLTPASQIAAAGSCFAQHIGACLRKADCAYLVTERPHPIMSAETALRLNYGVFTARYGNIYTSRQLLQLFDRAYGLFSPQEDVWREPSGVLIDPFRPNIQPGGYNCPEEYAIDRERHFAAVRAAFETLDAFIFTLGLTEAWRARSDGAVYPLCPGVRGGIFSAEKYEFFNMAVEEVIADLRSFFAKLRGVNPAARLILTVSPTPLAATASGAHVLNATFYSKSVLRAASGMLAQTEKNVAYFPSFEIISGCFGGPNYYEADRRAIRPEGVRRVMGLFLKHYLPAHAPHPHVENAASKTVTPAKNVMTQALQQMCDEEALGVR